MLRSRLQTMNITIWAIDIRLFLTPIKDYVLRKLVWGANKCTSSKLGRQVAIFSLAANICRSQDWKKFLNHGSQFSLTAETEAFKSFTILVKLQLGLVWQKMIYNLRNPCNNANFTTNKFMQQLWQIQMILLLILTRPSVMEVSP